MVCKVGTAEDRRKMSLAHSNAEHDDDNVWWAQFCKDCYFELLAKGFYK